ncbi:MAG: 30S ribosomal protein S9 [Planctomycetes bacterium]|nr:30S ribosomal protein S9 [Planctomycetota bacterium]
MTEVQSGAAAPAAEVGSSLPPPPSSGTFVSTGRRKSSVARVRLTPGNGSISINGRELNDYFKVITERDAVTAPLSATKTTGMVNLAITVMGGGRHGQADAVRLGVSRALVKAEKRYEPPLRDRGYLTRDSREVERKKYGRRKARRRFQFSKR